MAEALEIRPVRTRQDMNAFIRAAYGKGYCDALTEESPGALCLDHGYRMPERPASSTARSGWHVHQRDAA